ncbi:PucR family transcriptional regulator [Nocardia inohanensis]|uniref:PucR family transcriptional regulator n=1 Tax=Nocardia inohanensis TaxID=209246 RepID=UPI00082C2813|nr:helix-turn-helix domain-containing protein [Nocardia inohanensis]
MNGSDPELVELMGRVAELMLEDLDRLVAEMDAAEIELSPMVGADAALIADMSASNRANAARLLTILARRETQLSADDVPPEALDVARTVARRGLDLDVIFQSYRRGQNTAWRHYLVHATRIAGTGPRLAPLLELSAQRMFAYVDQVVARVISVAQREREEILGGALARRAETIRLILDGAPIDSRRAGERLGYDLSRSHIALVLWSPPAGEVQGALEQAATMLARAAGLRPPLTFSAGSSALWAWMSGDVLPPVDVLRDALDAVPAGVRAAIGPPRAGITGFRRSHEAALGMHNLLAGQSDADRVTVYHDLEVTALAAQNITRAVEFVADTLGPLAADTPAAARLRETLRTFLDEAENAPRTAARLHTHRNTVLQRVARATELLGHPLGERRLAVELALEIAHRLGTRVLVRQVP